MRREKRPIDRTTLEHSWYGDAPWRWLKPPAWLFARVVALRRAAYASGWLKPTRLPVPVLIVGNIGVGGSGKTPLVIALAARLAAHGRRVGVVSRGYGGRTRHYPLVVAADTPAAVAGDEPVLIARRSRAAVAVDPDRPRAARALIETAGVDVVLADDGLQHYALARDAEIAVVDAARGLGNGWLLPAGPLREPAARLDSVDLVLTHGAERDFWLAPGHAVRLVDGASRALAGFASMPVHAVAGIGDPARFFAMLADHGLDVVEHPLADHHPFTRDDIVFDDDQPVLMTEKDAVKCHDIADRRHWSVPVEACFSADARTRVDALLDRLCAAHPPQRESASP